MSTEEKKESEKFPFERKSCYDCAHLKSALSWWCSSREAIDARGTSLPGVIHCPFWSPDWNYIDDKYKTVENGWIIGIENAKELTSRESILRHNLIFKLKKYVNKG